MSDLSKAFYDGKTFNSASWRNTEENNVNKVYSELGKPFYSSNKDYTLSDFLGLSKECYNKSWYEPLNLEGNKNAEKDNEFTQSIKTQASQIASEQIIQNFYDMYIGHEEGLDAFYRLGKVKGTLPYNADTSLNKQTDKDGRIYTRSNFSKTFQFRHYSPLNDKKYVTTNFEYANLSFPPFRDPVSGSVKVVGEKEVSTMSLKDWMSTRKSNVNNKDLEGIGILNKDTQRYFDTFDLEEMKCARVGFTYRDPGFKAINDNISLLQYLFEGISGIVSTNLSEWDLSLYMQENLISDSQGLTPEFVTLVHRLYDDNPMGYDDDKATSFGILNCAVSKLLGNNEAPWFPSAHPLSHYWTYYPDVDYYKLKDKIYTNKGWVYFPDFYTKVRNNKLTISDLKQQILYDDYLGAALSGYEDWYFNGAYKALYTTPDDNVSDIDNVYSGAELGLYSIYDLIDEVMENLYGASYGNSKTVSNSVVGAAAVCSSDVIFNEDGSVRKIDEGNDGGKKFLAMLKTKKSKRNAGIKAAESKRQEILNEFAGATTLGVPSAYADNSKYVGVAQRNPTLYGGPHGYYYSPKNVKSYFEFNNLFWRNKARLDTFINLDNSKKQNINQAINSHTNAYWNYRNCIVNSDDNGSEISDFSLADSLHLLKNGLGGTRKFTAKGKRREYNWFEVTTKRISHPDGTSHVEEEKPSTWKGKSITYLNTYENRPVVEEYVSGYTGRGSPSPSYIDSNGHTCIWKNGSRGWGYYKGGTAKHRKGYIVVDDTQTFERANLHSMPNASWSIIKVTSTANDTPIKVGFWKKIGNFFTGKKSIAFAAGETTDSYMLKFNDDYSKNGKLMTVTDESKGTSVTFGNTANELECMSKMIKMSNDPDNVSTDLVFCVTDSNNEVDGIFIAPCSIKKRNLKYKVKHVKTYTYKKEVVYFEDKTAPYEWISVDLNHAKAYWPNLKTSGSSVGISAENILEQSEPSAVLDKLHPVTLLNDRAVSGVYFDKDGKQQTSTVGFKGIGVLGFIPGFDPEIESDSTANMIPNELKTLIGLQSIDTNQKTVALKDLTIPYYKVDGTTKKSVNIDGYTYSSSGDVPDYKKAGNLPKSLVVALANLYTRCTIYKDDQIAKEYEDEITGKIVKKEADISKSYVSTLDNAIRDLYNVVLQQRDYINFAEELFLGLKNKGTNPIVSAYDIKSILYGTAAMPSLVSNRTLYLSDPKETTIKDSDKTIHNKSEYLGYNKGISLALEYFNPDNIKNTIAELEKYIYTRQSELSVLEKDLAKLVNREASEYSYKEIIDALNIVQSLYNTIINFANYSGKKEFLENYIYAYLNILYESRRYFINKRCNKQDGTLWLCRHLETAVNVAVSNLVDLNFSVNLNDLGATNHQKVAFYEIQNTNAKKNEALRNHIRLDYDRVKTCYVPIKWATEEDYIKDSSDYNKGLKKEHDIVKIKEWAWNRKPNGDIDWSNNNGRSYTGRYKYAIKPKNGKYRLESKEFIDNESKKSWNASLLPEEFNKKKEIDSTIETSIFNIVWGATDSEVNSERGDTDVIFDYNQTVDGLKMMSLMNNNVKDPMSLICGAKDPIDFWQVKIVGNMPRAEGYKTKIRLSLYSDNDIGSNGGDPEMALCGISAYTLSPIVEEQQSQFASLAKLQQSYIGLTNN